MSVIENLMGVLVIYDAIIAGYGPTGAVAANLLGDAGLNVLRTKHVLIMVRFTTTSVEKQA